MKTLVPEDPGDTAEPLFSLKGEKYEFFMSFFGPYTNIHNLSNNESILSTILSNLFYFPSLLWLDVFFPWFYPLCFFMIFCVLLFLFYPINHCLCLSVWVSSTYITVFHQYFMLFYFHSLFDVLIGNIILWTLQLLLMKFISVVFILLSNLCIPKHRVHVVGRLDSFVLVGVDLFFCSCVMCDCEVHIF